MREVLQLVKAAPRQVSRHEIVYIAQKIVYSVQNRSGKIRDCIQKTQVDKSLQVFRFVLKSLDILFWSGILVLRREEEPLSNKESHMKVQIHSIDLSGNEVNMEVKFTRRMAENIDTIMQTASERFQVYTITAPDGTIIAELV